jgi:hypothetical protein
MPTLQITAKGLQAIKGLSAGGYISRELLEAPPEGFTPVKTKTITYRGQTVEKPVDSNEAENSDEKAASTGRNKRY